MCVVLRASCICKFMAFIKLGKLTHYSKNFPPHSYCFVGLQAHTYVKLFDFVTQVSEALFIFLQSILSSSDFKTFYLCSFSLTLSSAITHLLPRPSSELFQLLYFFGMSISFFFFNSFLFFLLSFPISLLVKNLFSFKF